MTVSNVQDPTHSQGPLAHSCASPTREALFVLEHRGIAKLKVGERRGQVN